MMRGRKVFFFEKKKQKLLNPCARAGRSAQPNEQKFFGAFFQKRTASFAIGRRRH
jgi:hypothetical protein